MKIVFVEKDRRIEAAKKKLGFELVFEPNLKKAIELIKTKKADILIGGLQKSTEELMGESLRAIKPKEFVSTYFVLKHKRKTFLLADCAININPNSKELAKIAENTAKAAKKIKLKPKIAFLSFSTKGSSSSEETKKIRNAVKLTKFPCEGEIQLDAAINPKISKIKGTKGNANVLIFPDLNSGNIGYKLIKEFSDAKIVGPITWGLPVHDMSRGATAEDLIETIKHIQNL